MAVMTRTKELLLGLFRNYLPLSGGTMTGEIEFSPNQKLPSGLVIGQIVESVLPLTDAGLHLLDGAKLPANGMYAEFYQHCQTIQASHPSLFVSESDWQSTFSTYGSCGKFVLDSNGVRLPSISNIVQGTSDASQLGALVEAGLPNITGSYGNNIGETASIATNSALYITNQRGHAAWSGSTSVNRCNSLNLDASRSSSIYGNSSTVQPQTIKVLLYICVATSVKTPILADVDQIATDLNGKLDKSGGVMTGNITFPNGGFLGRNSDGTYPHELKFDANGDWTGSALIFYDKNSDNNPGSFALRAKHGDGDEHILQGFADGGLTWDGKAVQTSETMIIEGVDFSASVAGNSTTTKTVTIPAKLGYKALFCFMRATGNNTLYCYNCSFISGTTTATVQLRNITGTTQNVTTGLYVLYIKE